jgi:hypothetical protein
MWVPFPSILLIETYTRAHETIAILWCIRVYVYQLPPSPPMCGQEDIYLVTLMRRWRKASYTSWWRRSRRVVVQRCPAVPTALHVGGMGGAFQRSWF